MIARRDRLKLLKYHSVGEAELNSGAISCYICGKSTCESLAMTRFKHRYMAGGDDIYQLVCLNCLSRTLKIDPVDLDRIRQEIRYLRNEDDLQDLLLIIKQIGGEIHPTLANVIERHQQRKSLPPTLISEAYTLANVYSRDHSLWNSYRWLQSHKDLAKDDEIVARSLTTFAGVGNHWPSMRDRQYIFDLRNPLPTYD